MMPKKPRPYFTEQQRAELYAAYREIRALYRPSVCTDGADGVCWVLQGPPALDGNRRCRFCLASPCRVPHSAY